MLIAICEDDPYYQEGLKNYCEKWAEKHSETPVTVHCYPTPDSMLNTHEHPPDYDLYFLDIEFGAQSSMNGYRLAELIREHNTASMIVFVTNSRNYILNGYNVSAYRYLVKPIDEASMNDCLDHCVKEVLRFSDSFLSLVKKDGVSRIRLHDIIWIESTLHAVAVHTAGKTETAHIYSSFETYIQSLPENRFIRCQRGLLVNPQYVSKFSRRDITLTNGMEFTIGKKYQEKVCLRLREYFLGGQQ